MPKIKIIQISHKPTKSGKAVICGIKTKDKNGQEVWVNGWGNDTTKSWSIGQEVELDIYQEEYNGVNRLKFKDVKQRNVFEELDEIKKTLNLILLKVRNSSEPVDTHEPPAGTQEIKVEEIPF